MAKRNLHFTLIELLTVIVIMVILVALLFPILVNTRKRAKETVCTNNLKQSSSARYLYAADWDRFCINVIYHHASNWNAGWYSWAGPLFWSGLIEEKSLTYVCPEAGYQKLANGQIHYTWIINRSSYGSNYANFYRNNRNHGYREVVTGEWTWAFTLLDRINSPDKFLFLFDSKGRDFPYMHPIVWPGIRTWSGIPWTIHRPHRTVNTLFADGHLESASLLPYQEYWHTDAVFVYDPYASW